MPVSGIESLKSLESRSTTTVIADELRRLIVNGTFLPREQLTEAKIADQLSVSRGPVREALQRLVQEGLLESQRNRGVFVIDISPSDVAEIYAARQAIESSAAITIMDGAAQVRKKTADGLSAIVRKMAASVQKGNWQKVAEIDLDFHTYLVSAAGNSRLVRAYSTLAAESLVCMNRLENAYLSSDSLATEHQRLVDLLLGQDKVALIKALEIHMTSAITDLSSQISG
jgi:DNA-binding GntR family transcriptional regulator